MTRLLRPHSDTVPRHPVLFVIGPTASGKSAAAHELALRLHGEIISADSMQIYRGMDIGTAKPSKKMQCTARYHLIDIRTPGQNYSVVHFYKNALTAIRSVIKRKRLPIVAGGTGFYVRALLEGLASSPPPNPSLRKRLETLARRKGTDELYRLLVRQNKARALLIQPGD